jgi:hypothetical protein
VPCANSSAQVCAYSEERAQQRVATKCAPRGHASKTKGSKLVDGVGDDLHRFRIVVGIRRDGALAAAGTQRRRKSIKHDDCRKVMRQCKKTSRAKKLGQSTRRALNPTRQQHENGHIRKADPPERWESVQAKRAATMNAWVSPRIGHGRVTLPEGFSKIESKCCEQGPCHRVHEPFVLFFSLIDARNS